MEIFNQDQNAFLFQHEDTESHVWIGEPISLYARREFIPFRFVKVRYIMLMGHPEEELGGAQAVAALAASYANGFIPDKHSRAMKFQVADAKENAFEPAPEWALSNPRYIFQFSAILRDAVKLHYEHHPEITQYFYQPARPELGKLYRRAFGQTPKDCVLREFTPIIEADIGEHVNGYQRQKVA